ncbi:MAG: hypothetical protein KC479_00250 [Dehalococcoidia bacterium]|nr:hypothetical protein [Dehalococcoidia bacterium]
MSFSEYEAAALRTVACINEIGGGVYGEAKFNERTGEFELAARRDAQPGQRLDPRSDESQRQRDETDECYREHWNGVHQAWAAQYAPSEEEINEARQALAQCLREAGVDIPDPASQQDFAGLETHEAFFPCVERISDEYGIANFAG